MNILLVIITCLSIGCNSGSTESKATTIKSENKQPEKEILIGYKDFKLIDSLNKVSKTNANYDTELVEDCKNWSFSEKSLSNLLKKMRQVEGTEWYALCYDYPCFYEGIVSNGKTEYRITISSASFVNLSNDNEILIFILEEQSDIFLAVCDCCE